MLTTTSQQQAPAIPSDFSWLQGLDPGVAYSALAVIALGMLLFYLGPGLRDRFSRSTPPPPPTPAPLTEPAIPVVPPALPQAAAEAERISSQFIAHLQKQVQELERENDDLRHDLAKSNLENDRLRWQRGGELR